MELEIHKHTDLDVVKNRPLVSVIIASYNHEHYIETCIQSVFSQTYRNIELIIIDDGSTDGSLHVIERLQNSHEFIFIKQANKGLPATLNRSLALAKGEYISFLASDDEYLPSKLEILVSVMQQKGKSCAVAFGDAEFMDSFGRTVKRTVGQEACGSFIAYNLSRRSMQVLAERLGSYETLIEGNYIPAMSALIRRDALFDVGLFDEDIAMEDWNIWLKLAKKFEFSFFDEVVARYRIHSSNSITTRAELLSHDALNLLIREEKYCKEQRCFASWQRGYYNTLHIYRRNFGLKACIGKLRFSQYLAFVRFNLLRLYERRFGSK